MGGYRKTALLLLLFCVSSFLWGQEQEDTFLLVRKSRLENLQSEARSLKESLQTQERLLGNFSKRLQGMASDLTVKSGEVGLLQVRLETMQKEQKALNGDYQKYLRKAQTSQIVGWTIAGVGVATLVGVLIWIAVK